MKNQIIMWNHLQYSDQIKAMDLISNLMEEQSDATMRTALSAALTELEIWSNASIDNINILVHDASANDEDQDTIIEDEEPPTIH